MGKCDFTFELDGDGTHYVAGQVIHGRLTVRVNETVKCNALTLCHRWFTHGSGNVAKGDGPQQNLFSGVLNAGEVHHFDFELPLLAWPITYHGHHLNIDHCLFVNVDIPWAFDAKDEHRIVVSPSAECPTAAEVEQSRQQQQHKWVWFIVVPFILIFFIAFIPFAIFFGPIVALVAGVWWFFFSYLPKRMVGPAAVTYETTNVSVNTPVRGELTIHPAKPLPLNCITCKLIGEEVCVSGSGSNRRTHRHRIVEKDLRLVPEGTLPAGLRRFPIELMLPADAPPTLKLSDNEIRWRVETRIDIPKWPDWSHTETLAVSPMVDGAGKASGRDIDADGYASVGSQRSTNQTTDSNQGIDFIETANFLVAAQDDEEKVQQVVKAVRGMEFAVTAKIERTALYSGEADREFAYPQGRIAYADHQDSSLKLTLYFPPEQMKTLNDLGSRPWTGRAVAMGYDAMHNRLQMRIPS